MNKREKDLERRRLALLEGLRRGERAALEGRTVSHEEARKRLSRWLGSEEYPRE
ncbi:hypothetical protein LL252_03600 [Alcanivorax marinus]|uniref:Uncharacterized protein n=1 Tax=Alloalcanivorax marinus TaxID=1177169 RepID=A0A9Q3UMC4_9GAMM|nr:hypothetical protein [Alloalcanivorax marinus]MCC4307648.1 hypothetical protein [Alloalcanivorax marinus]